MGGAASGVTTSQLRRSLLLMWGAIVACAAGLVALRACLGGEVLDLDTHGTSLLRWRRLTGGQVALVAGGIVWTVLWLLVALDAVRRITRRLPPPGAQGPQ